MKHAALFVGDERTATSARMLGRFFCQRFLEEDRRGSAVYCHLAVVVPCVLLLRLWRGIRMRNGSNLLHARLWGFAEERYVETRGQGSQRTAEHEVLATLSRLPQCCRSQHEMEWGCRWHFVAVPPYEVPPWHLSGAHAISSRLWRKQRSFTLTGPVCNDKCTQKLGGGRV
ncbi:unnamed protein product, partial [Scytosiphon promiscuus]